MTAPKMQTMNAGDRHVTQGIDQFTGQVMPGTERSTPILQSADNKASGIVSTGNSIRSTGAMLENAQSNRDAASITAGATRDAASMRRDQDTEMKLADDYRGQSKDFRDASAAYKQITATLDSATKSPAATLAAATKFMKILDPGSVVRESELGMALAASGVIDRMANYMNTLQRGKVLTENQVKDFKDISTKIYQAAQETQKMVDADYGAKAKAYKLRSEMITQDLGQNTPINAAPSAPSSATPASGGWSMQRVP
jgi:hypothetical protein